MKPEFRELEIAWPSATTLVWDQDELVDVTARERGKLDGSRSQPTWIIGYEFDRAIGLRHSGVFWAVAYTNRATKAVLLNECPSPPRVESEPLLRGGLGLPDSNCSEPHRELGTKHENQACIEELRSGVLMVLRRVLIVEGAMPRVGASYFRKEPILFSDSESKLKLQIGMVELVIKSFNAIALKFGMAEINLDDLRSSLQAKIEREVTTCVDLARLAMLASFGEEKEYRAAQAAMSAS